MRRIVFAVGVLVLTLGVSVAFAKLREMECREWTGETLQGDYRFVIDSEAAVANVEWNPINEDWEKPLFATNPSWRKLWQDESGRKVVIYSINEGTNKGLLPVMILSIDFSSVNFAEYYPGAIWENEASVGSSESHCTRLD